MKKNLIVANWKANPATLREAVDLAQKTERAASIHRNVSVVIAPPFPFLSAVAPVLKRVKLGSQDAFWEDAGPYTGEVSWRQLKRLKVRYVIVGHSERRLLLGETDEMINKKIRALLEHGFTPILCAGEQERADHEMPEAVARQIQAALAGVKKNTLKNLIIAYEPVWAISTTPHSQPDTPENAFSAQIYMRKVLSRLFGRSVAERVRIMYGGSVNAENISSFLRGGHMQGALVGRASMNAEAFGKIVRASA